MARTLRRDAKRWIRRVSARGTMVLWITLNAGACELQQKDPIEPEDILVAEGRLVARLDLGGDVSETEMTVLLHRTLGLDDPRATEGATVRITDESGDQALLPQVSQEDCFVQYVDSTDVPAQPPVRKSGTCYKLTLLSGTGQRAPFEPGDVVSLEVATTAGEILVGQSRIPGHYELVGGFPRNVSTCRIDPNTTVPLSWSPSEGTWAYLAETTIGGLREALSPQGIEAPDGLYLTGLSVSQSDVDIVFPAEFGIFDRFDLERDLAAVLQVGIPEGVTADIGISALDRNYVNWARGGSFNPSGAVRIPSISGDGTGVFGTGVQYQWRLIAESADGSEFPSCVP